MTDFLRGELGFQGLTIADAIDMKGFQKNGPPEEMSVDAVIAGCDSICVFSGGTESVGMVFDQLMKAVQSKRLTQERLDEAVLRHLKFMDWLGLLGGEPRVSTDLAEELLRDEQANQFLAKIVGVED